MHDVRLGGYGRFYTGYQSKIVAVLMTALAFARPSAGQPVAQRAASALDSVQWSEPGSSANLGATATLVVPKKCRFTGSKGAKPVLEATQNVPTGNELGVLVCAVLRATEKENIWFVIFEFDKSGFIKDDEKNSLDGDKMLASIREGTEAGNSERKSRGWPTMSVDGWGQAPFYDVRTHNLTWSIRGHDSNNGPVVNHSVRLLGREGVLKAELVTSPADFAAAVERFDGVVATTAFVPGQRYSEWKQGDKIAEYGLTALVVGGAGAAALKLGLLGKLWKFIAGLFFAMGKLIFAAVVGLLAWIKSLFSGKKRTPNSPPPMPPTP